MLKSFKVLLVVASSMGFFLISLTDYAKAGTAGASGCVDFCKSDCYFAQYNDCLDECSGYSRRDKGLCIANCKIEVACCFDECLYGECYLGADSHPAFCQNGA